MFGKEARLTVYLCFGICPDKEDGLKHHKHVANMRKELVHWFTILALLENTNYRTGGTCYPT